MHTQHIFPHHKTILFIFFSILLSSCSINRPDTLGERASNRQLSHRLHIEACNAALSGQDDLHAINLWKQAIAADPNYTKPIKFIASHYIFNMFANENDHQKGNYHLNQSRLYADLLISLDPTDADGYYLGGFSCQAKGLPGEAVSYYLSLIKLFPDKKYLHYKTDQLKIDTIYGIAISYGLTKDYANCLLYLEKYIIACSKSNYNGTFVSEAKKLLPTIQQYLTFSNPAKRQQLTSSPNKIKLQNSIQAIPAQNVSQESTPTEKETLTTKVKAAVETQQLIIDKELERQFDKYIVTLALKQEI